jgi:hypothetical protein
VAATDTNVQPLEQEPRNELLALNARIKDLREAIIAAGESLKASREEMKICLEKRAQLVNAARRQVTK